jgi:hypothetical protein
VTPEQAAWLAGLLDGEGCFDDPRSNARVRIKMSDLDVVLRAANLMGARTHPEIIPGRKPLLVAQITGQPAINVLYAVLPYLGARRTARATEIILRHQAKAEHRPALRLVLGAAA